MIRLLLVDDHELVRTGIKRLLANTKDIFVAAEAATGKEAIQLASARHPDVVLMDMRLPDMDGADVAEQILRLNPLIKIVALTASAEKLVAADINRLGLSGYLTKDTHIDMIIKAIRQAGAGQTYVEPKIAQQLAIKHFETKLTSFDSLSRRELQVTALIVKGYSVQEISDHLNLSFKTVNTYRYRLFDKLNVSSNLELTKLAAKQHLDVTEVLLERE